jgi:alginate O-acetyltransferase complex protein AlgI
MLFNSYVFIFAYLPVTLIVYFILNRFRFVFASNCWLALSSLFFYSWWNISYLPLMLGSILFNYIVSRLLQGVRAHSYSKRSQSIVLLIGISGNIGLLGYYKYADFFLMNVSDLIGQDWPLLRLLLPLGISFFTFTQIAYLVDTYKNKAREYNFVNYILFVTFFPHLLAGPILHHSEMMPQFDQLRNKIWNWKNASIGMYIFCMGLFKKVVIADTFAVFANDGFTNATQFIDSWVASLSYTFQLYYDFSGYTDMAIGIALLFNIKLPQNFNSPYKAVNIQDFWRRWHITLSRFLRDYIYIPLGGNRLGEFRMLRNIIITFLIGGLWHGAGWTFIFWGLLHGIGQVIHRLWSKFGIVMPRWVAWLITFHFINLTWVFFRAESWAQSMRIIKGMAGLNGISLIQLNDQLLSMLPAAILICIFLFVVVFTTNTAERVETFRPSWREATWMATLFILSMLFYNQVSEFLYFNF